MQRLIAPLRSYYHFARTDTRLIAFGFLLTLCSSFGQTFFIALFNESIRSELGLSDGRFGLIYSLATLASAISLVWLGPLVDKLNLRLMTVAVCCGMIVAGLLMAWTYTVPVLLIALYLLRVNGQGLLGHISITSMARYFDRTRGKAVSIASLGYAAGEAMMPILAVSAMALITWRQTWLGVACLFALVLIPLAMVLLRGHARRHERHLNETESDEAELQASTAAHVAAAPARHWTRSETLRDWRFYLMMPAALMPAFVVTGIFFHQQRMVAEKGWSIEWFAVCFIAFAASQFPSSLIYGELIDRFTARRCFPVFLLPLALAMLVLALAVHPAAAFVMMLLIGLTSGAVGTLASSTLAEMYGVRHIGAIRSLWAALMVFSTALSPFLMGTLIDRDVTVSTMALGFVGLTLLASVLSTFAVRAEKT